MLTLWMFAVLIVGLLVLLAGGIVALVRDGDSAGGFVCSLLGGLFLGIAVLAAAITIPSQHTTALSIPIKIAALERTIEQQTALISDDATLGQGLEGLEIKREIQSTIRELNDLIAKAEYIAISPWWMFKPDMGDS